MLQALDGAVRADLKSLRIIHGKGTGALREGVDEMLRKDTRVREFRLGRVERRRRGRHPRGVRVIPDETSSAFARGRHRRGDRRVSWSSSGRAPAIAGPVPFITGTHRNFSVSPKRRCTTASSATRRATSSPSSRSGSASTWSTAVKMVAEKSGVEVVEVASARASRRTRASRCGRSTRRRPSTSASMLWEATRRPGRARLPRERGITREARRPRSASASRRARSV